MFPPCAGLSKITNCSWKVSDAAVNIEKCAVKIKATSKNGEAVVVVAQSSPRFFLQMVVMPSPETCTN
jgi:hypothetical protein